MVHTSRTSETRMRSRCLAAACAALAALGCNRSEPAAHALPFSGITLTIAAVEDPQLLEAVRVQTPEWSSRTGAQIEIKPDAAGTELAADVLVFPGEHLGRLIDAGALARIPETAVRPTENDAIDLDADSNDLDAPASGRRDPLDFNDIAQPYREQVTQYGDDRYALPLGGSALVLVRRREAFQSENNRAAALAAGVALDPPATWDQLDAQVRFFEGRDWNNNGQPDHGLAIATAVDPDRMLTLAFLARASTLGQPPDQFDLLFDAETMDARLSSPPFVEALVQTLAILPHNADAPTFKDSEAARAAFRAGRAPVLIDRAERAGSWTDPKSPFPVEVFHLPASPRVFDPVRKTWLTPPLPNRVAYLPSGGGWLVGIHSRVRGKSLDAAISFLQMIASPETSQAIVSDPAFPLTPVRISHLALGLPDPQGAPLVDSRAWGVAVSQTFGAPRVVVGLRIPEAEEYLDELGHALQQAATGGATPEQALAQAEAAWNARTEKIGRARQLWHYRRSLNRLSTTREPPERP